MTATLQRRLRPSATDTAFRSLVAEAGKDVRALVDALTAGDLTPAEWHDQMLETLAGAHAEAGYRGRLRAGDTAPYDRDDVRFGQLVAWEEQPYLDGFRRDLESGKYAEGDAGRLAITRRALMYVNRLYGTANEAVVLVAGDEELWHWRRGKTDSCSACVRLEENSPYRGHPPTTPRSGATPCLSSCGCTCTSSSGLETFAP